MHTGMALSFFANSKSLPSTAWTDKIIHQVCQRRKAPMLVTQEDMYLLDLGWHTISTEIGLSRADTLITCQHFESGCFSCAVDPQQSEAFSLFDAEAEPVDCGEAAVLFLQVLQYEGVWLHQLCDTCVQDTLPLCGHVTVLAHLMTRLTWCVHWHHHLTTQLLVHLHWLCNTMSTIKPYCPETPHITVCTNY